jgi:hypothetical protein
MNTFLIIVLLALMALVVVSLVRGVIAFLQTTKLDIENGGDGNIRELQLKQNRMMFARVKFQALAVVVIFIIMMVGR